MITDVRLGALAARLAEVPAVVGVLMGGSRARNTHTPESYVDLGLYCRPPLDVAVLGDLAREVAGTDAEVTEPGAGGPWVDGGAWLTIDGKPVDWISRDLDRVHAAWTDAVAGRFAFHAQVGHPLGVPDFAYPGEVALGVVLADPTGELRQLHQQTLLCPRRWTWCACACRRTRTSARGTGSSPRSWPGCARRSWPSSPRPTPSRRPGRVRGRDTGPARGTGRVGARTPSNLRLNIRPSTTPLPG